MRMGEIARRLDLRCLIPEIEDIGNCEILHAHISDVLSKVIAQAQRGSLRATLQADLMMMAAAVLKGLSGVVSSRGVRPDDFAVSKAVQERVPLYGSAHPAFTVAAGLPLLGIRDHQNA